MSSYTRFDDIISENEITDTRDLFEFNDDIKIIKYEKSIWKRLDLVESMLSFKEPPNYPDNEIYLFKRNYFYIDCELEIFLNLLKETFKELDVISYYSINKGKLKCFAVRDFWMIEFRIELYKTQHSFSTNYYMEFNRRSGDRYSFSRLFSTIKHKLLDKGLKILSNDGNPITPVYNSLNQPFYRDHELDKDDMFNIDKTVLKNDFLDYTISMIKSNYFESITEGSNILANAINNLPTIYLEKFYNDDIIEISFRILNMDDTQIRYCALFILFKLIHDGEIIFMKRQKLKTFIVNNLAEILIIRENQDIFYIRLLLKFIRRIILLDIEFKFLLKNLLINSEYYTNSLNKLLKNCDDFEIKKLLSSIIVYII